MYDDEGKENLLELCLLMKSLALISFPFFPSYPFLLFASPCLFKQGLCSTLAGIVGDTWANLALIS